MLAEKWLNEYEGEITQLSTNAIELYSHLKEVLKNERMIITYRIKTIESLREKIKRNKMEKNATPEEKIFDVLDDAIGIRIICMKNEDEKNINTKINNTINELSDLQIVFLESFDIQPVKQKNGHDIYKIKGKYKDKYPFELQIKSLANLFWGEMEHLLIYKNNRFIISNAYYKKEMESIHEELSIIDGKLSYMEDIMIKEDQRKIINEKKDVFKRYAYLNLRLVLKDSQGEELNNNYLYDGVANYIFKEVMPTKKSQHKIDKDDYYNEIMLNSFNFLLDKSKTSFRLNQFDVNLLDNILDSNDSIHKIIKIILKEKDNCWWYFVIISAIIDYNKTSNFVGTELNENILKQNIEQCIDFINNNINRYLNLTTQLDFINENFSINELAKRILEEQIKHFANNKDLRITDIDFLSQYSIDGAKILTYLFNSIDINTKISDEPMNKIVESIVKILHETNNPNANITKFVSDLNESIKIVTGGLNLPLYEKLLSVKEKVTYKKLFNYIDEEGKEGDENDK